MAPIGEFIILTLFAVTGAAVAFALTFYYFKAKTYQFAVTKAEKLFEMQKTELEKAFEIKYVGELERWKVEWEDRFRRDAVERSRATLKGKIAEQLAPTFSSFGHNQADAHFIGAPVDYVIFDNYTKIKDSNSNEPITIVLADVKFGENAKLSREQWEIKKAVEGKRIRWETINLGKKL